MGKQIEVSGLDNQEEASVLQAILGNGETGSPGKQDVDDANKDKGTPVETPKGEGDESKKKDEKVEESAAGKGKEEAGTPSPSEPVSKTAEPKGEEPDLKAENAKLKAELDEIKKAKATPPEKTTETNPKPQAPQTPQFNSRVKVTEKDLEIIYGGGEDAVNWLNNFANSIKEDMAEIFLAYTDKQLAPIHQERSIRETEAHKVAFFKKYEALKPYESLVNRVATEISQEMQAGRAAFKTWDEVYDEAAKRTRDLIEVVNKVKPTTPPPPSAGSHKTPITKQTKPVDPDSDEEAIKLVLGK
jgi:hypothetical protein